MNFGEYVKVKRLKADLSLRKFCEKVNIDPSNWSKVERGMLSLNLEDDKIGEMARVLRLKDQKEEQDFFDYAMIARKKIPDYFYDINNKEFLDALPIFFRTASREKPSDEEFDKLINLIKKR